jgi:hypothetical protein
VDSYELGGGAVFSAADGEHEAVRRETRPEVLAEYESHFNSYRPHRALNHASPLRALPDPVDANIEALQVLG